MATFPKSSPYVVVGAGIHGLSTAYHLAKELTQRGLGSGRDVLVLDKRFARIKIGNSPIQRLHTGMLWAEGPV